MASRWVLVFACFVGVARADPMTVMVIPSVKLDENVPAELCTKVDELLGEGFAEISSMKLSSLSSTTPNGEPAGASSGVKRSIARGAAAYAQFRFADALLDYQSAVQAIEKNGVPAGESDALTQALTGVAVSAEAVGNKHQVRAACRELAVLRPGHQLDRVQVHPNVVATCTEEQLATSRKGARLLRVSSDPPLSKVYVDGVLRGITPLSTRLPLGRHWLFVAHEGMSPHSETLEIETNSAPLERNAVLRSDPTVLVEKARSQLRQRGPLPASAVSIVELARTAQVDMVVVVAIESAAKGAWRITAVAFGAESSEPRARALQLIDASMGNAHQAFQRIVAQLGAREKPAQLVEQIDWSQFVFGSTKRSAATPTPDLIDQGAAAKRDKSRRLAIGLGAGLGTAIVVAGVTLGLVFGLRDTREGWRAHGTLP